MEVFVEDGFNIEAWAVYGKTDAGCNVILNDGGEYITFNYVGMQRCINGSTLSILCLLF